MGSRERVRALTTLMLFESSGRSVFRDSRSDFFSRNRFLQRSAVFSYSTTLFPKDRRRSIAGISADCQSNRFSVSAVPLQPLPRFAPGVYSPIQMTLCVVSGFRVCSSPARYVETFKFWVHPSGNAPLRAYVSFPGYRRVGSQ